MSLNTARITFLFRIRKGNRNCFDFEPTNENCSFWGGAVCILLMWTGPICIKFNSKRKENFRFPLNRKKNQLKWNRKFSFRLEFNFMQIGPVHINDMQNPPPSKRVFLIFFCSKMTRDFLKRMKNRFLRFLFFGVLMILFTIFKSTYLISCNL